MNGDRAARKELLEGAPLVPRVDDEGIGAAEAGAAGAQPMGVQATAYVAPPAYMTTAGGGSADPTAYAMAAPGFATHPHPGPVTWPATVDASALSSMPIAAAQPIAPYDASMTGLPIAHAQPASAMASAVPTMVAAVPTSMAGGGLPK